MIYAGKAITVKEIDGGFAQLNFDLEGESVNKFNRLTIEELGAAAEALQSASGIKGLVVTSTKDCFIVGADITEFTGLFAGPEEELIANNLKANSVFNAIEDLPFPTVTAINGIALGGGFEMCLATDYRVMSTKAKVGLPEVKLGIFPGFGGTVRLPRLIGADNAIEWIAATKEHKAESALKFGAVDAVVGPEKLMDAAINLLEQVTAGKLDYEARRAEKTGKLNLNPMESMMVFETAKGFVAGQAGPHYPAPVEAIKAMQKHSGMTRDKAIEVEAKGFAKMAKTPVAASLVGLFLNDQELKAKAKKLEPLATEVKKAAVLGAGIMGGGIAYQSALKGTPIIMKDIDVDVVFKQDSAVSDEAYRLRAVRLGHSIMGGEWTAPVSVAGLPIFSAFHLQAAAGALFSSATRNSRDEGMKKTDDPDIADPLGPPNARDRPTRCSLHIGLGIGGSVTSLQKLGFASDCIELHPQMVHVAREFFHLNGTVCQIGDANSLVTNRHAAALPLDAYDVIIVDIFSGDANAVSRSGNRDFFAAISRASMANSAHSQVLVVNYFGLQGVQLNDLHDSMSQSFSTVNVYREEAWNGDHANDADHAISNFILVASNFPLEGMAPEHPARLLVSEPYSTVFADYKDHIVEVLGQRQVTDLKSTCGDVSSVVELVRHWMCHAREQLFFSGAHWRAMRSQFFVG